MRERCSHLEPLQSAYVDGTLRRDEVAAFARHLASCARCRADVESLRRTKVLLASLPARKVPAGVLPVTSSRRPKPHTVRRLMGRAVTGLVAAATALVMAAFALGGQPAADTPTVAVPVEVYVAQHLVRSVGGPVSTPAILDSP
jgi:anti-sigma factor RsiW